MTTEALFQGPVPELYDRLLVPLIFEAYATDLAARAATLRPGEVLEIAAGTGALTRALATTLGSSARITATDLSAAMLEVARLRQGGDPRIEWQTADAMALPFEAGRFDLVVCQFGAMFFPDKVAAFSQILRVLRRGGHFLFNVWDRIEANAFAECAHLALIDLFPDAPIDFMPRLPHGYADRSAIRSHLEAAGFEAISIESIGGTSRAPSALLAASAYCQGTPMRPEIEARRPGEIESITRHVAAALGERFAGGVIDVPIEGPISALVIKATRPS